jgi:3-hydroxyacyl-CoA dehydrogenase
MTPPQMRPVRSAAVLGAGTMGAQIAAHLANAGVPTLLLDLDRATAEAGLKRAAALKPDPFFIRDTLQLIEIGGFDRDLPRLNESDWIVEAIVERLEAKRHLLEKIDGVRHPDSIVSSNTSGIPLVTLAEGRSEGFKRHWLGTHFFNPPRYLRLLEVIPIRETDGAIVDRISSFADHRLGKGVVVAKDTPNFIANHIGLFGVVQTLRALDAGELSIEEIDAVTGPLLGRPRSATFRTLDITGVDVLVHVARNLHERLPDPRARQAFELPPLVHSLVERGWVGEKAGRGFYERTASGEILVLDPASMTYKPKQPVRLPSVEGARTIENLPERISTLFFGRDKVGQFLRSTLGATLLYTAETAPAIAYSIDDVDRAMRWGFGWELGPFETFDVLGVRRVLDAVRPGQAPRLAAEVLDSGRTRFREGTLPSPASDLQILASAKDRHRIVRRNAGASLVDLDDGVLAVEFHSKLNTIGGDTVAMLEAGVKEAAANFSALVIGSDAADFSAGANLVLVLLEAQEGNWDEIDLMVRTFQRATLALRYAEVPVVAAPAGRALGGGCEIVLHADRVQAAAESYIGLVEVGVGLIPAGGGTKEMLARRMSGASSNAVELLASSQSAFETIAFARVSASATHAKALGYLDERDGVTMNRDRLMADAKATALARARDGYAPPPPRNAIPVGGESVLAALKLGVHLAWRAGRISEHDATIGRALAGIVSGGSVPHATTVTEQHLLDLEREAFLRLAGEPKTLARMQHTLKTGKTLRN